MYIDRTYIHTYIHLYPNLWGFRNHLGAKTPKAPGRGFPRSTHHLVVLLGRDGGMRASSRSALVVGGGLLLTSDFGGVQGAFGCNQP